MTWLEDRRPFAPDRRLRRAARRVRLRRASRRGAPGDIPSVATAAARAAPRRVPGGQAEPADAAYPFSVESYLGFLTEFDEETLFDEMPRRERQRFLATLRERLMRLVRRRPDLPGADRLRDGDRARTADRSTRAGSALVRARTRRRPSAPDTLGLRPRRPRPRPFLALGDDRDLLDLDARRLDLGDDLLAVGQQGHVAGDRQVADVDRAVEVDQRLDGVLDRLRQVIGQGPDPDRLGRVQERAAELARPRATRRSGRAARRPSAPRSCGPGTGRRGAGGG